MRRQGSVYSYPRTIPSRKHEIKVPTGNLDSLILGVFTRENKKNMSIEVIFKKEIRKKFSLLVLIVLVLYLCYRLELINAIENVIGNLIAALIILLGKN